MRSRWCWCATSLWLLAAAPWPLAGATVRERTVAITIAADGSLREVSRLVVAIEDGDDAASWSSYRILLDDNRSLEAVAARAVHADGRETVVAAADQEARGAGGDSVFHASHGFHLLRFRDLAPGATVVVETTVRFTPYHPSSRVVLRGASAIERLEVAIDGGGDGWRFLVDGAADGLEVVPRPGGVTVRGSDLPPLVPPPLAPALAPVLRFAWGEGGTWADVGRWYRQLMAPLARAASPVRSAARALIADAATPRERLDAVLAFVQDKVRYVAVEVGIGGYRPSPPAVTLERRWGDCKDKSLLLVDLLQEAGIEAYPALVRRDAGSRIEPRFATPEQFNHMVVAVAAEAVAAADGDPVAGGLLFVDPTQARGRGRWLHPAAQDQDALVLRADGARLIRTPLDADGERRSLELTLAVDAAGDARGRLALRLDGELADTFLAEVAARTPAGAEAAVRGILGTVLAATDLEQVRWRGLDQQVPAAVLEAAVTLRGLVQGLGARPSLKLSGMRATPEPHLLPADRDAPLVVPARVARTVWRLRFPAGWCPPTLAPQAVENPLGSFRQSLVRGGDGTVTIERVTALRQRWIEPAAFGDLTALATAEHRAHRRRVRLRCTAGAEETG